jgi:hypothetical protein
VPRAALLREEHDEGQTRPLRAQICDPEAVGVRAVDLARIGTKGMKSGQGAQMRFSC